MGKGWNKLRFGVRRAGGFVFVLVGSRRGGKGTANPPTDPGIPGIKIRSNISAASPGTSSDREPSLDLKK